MKGVASSQPNSMSIKKIKSINLCKENLDDFNKLKIACMDACFSRNNESYN